MILVRETLLDRITSLHFGIAALTVLAGCHSASNRAARSDAGPACVTEILVLSPGDEVEVRFYYTPELNVTQAVRPDGKIMLQLIGEVEARGKSPEDLRAELHQRYVRVLKEPDITVLTRSLYTRRVYVGGQVMSPGVVNMPSQMTVLEAIMQAGGFRLPDAEVRNVVVIRHEDDRRYGYSVDVAPALGGQEATAVLPGANGYRPCPSNRDHKGRPMGRPTYKPNHTSIWSVSQSQMGRHYDRHRHVSALAHYGAHVMASIAADHAREQSLRDFYYVVFRHKWQSLLFFLVVFGIVAVATLLAPDIYRSEARFLVKLGRESVAVDPTVPEGRIVSINRQMEEQLNSELQILRSRDLVERVVDAVGPERFLKESRAAPGLVATGGGGGAVQNAFRRIRAVLEVLREWPSRALVRLGIRDELTSRERAIEELSQKVDVDVLPKSSVICSAFESRSPRLSEEVLDTLTHLYLEQHVQVHKAGGSYQFFKLQTENLGYRLADMEETLRKFKDQANIAALSEQRTAAVRRMEDTKSRMRGGGC